jgi:hypothetical protein
MSIVNFAAAVTQAAQMLGVLDSGESLSTQQEADALTIANDLLESWYNEQIQALDVLLADQAEAGNIFAAQQAKITSTLALAYTLGGATYHAPTYTPGSIFAGSMPQFPSTAGSVTLPTGYDRAFILQFAIELAPEYMMAPSQDLIANATAAKAAAAPMPGKIPVPGMGSAEGPTAPAGGE